MIGWLLHLLVQPTICSGAQGRTIFSIWRYRRRAAFNIGDDAVTQGMKGTDAYVLSTELFHCPFPQFSRCAVPLGHHQDFTRLGLIVFNQIACAANHHVGLACPGASENKIIIFVDNTGYPLFVC